MRQIAVLGAGITGVTTAYALALRGFDVTVLERHRYVAMDTSFANGGQLSASNAEVWNHASTILKGIKWMFTADAPLLVNPMPSWHKLSWFMEFMANIPDYEKNTIATTKLAIEARKHLLSWAETEKIDFDHKKEGILHIYRKKENFDHAVRVSELLAKGGLPRRQLSPSEISEIEPTLAGQYHGGFFTETDSTGDIHKFTHGLAAAAERRGVKFIYGAEVIRTSASDQDVVIAFNCEGAERQLQADAVVVCAGIGSRHIAKMLGDRINVYPVKGYSITVNLTDELSQKSAPRRWRCRSPRWPGSPASGHPRRGAPCATGGGSQHRAF